MTFQQYLNNKIYACRQAREWATDKTAAQAWNECERADWLMWWVNQEVDEYGPGYTDGEIRKVWFLLKSMVRMIPMPTEIAEEYCMLLDLRLASGEIISPKDTNRLYTLVPNILFPKSSKDFCLKYLLDIIYQKNPGGHYVVGILSNFQSIGEVSDENRVELAQIVKEGFKQPWKEDSENV